MIDLKNVTFTYKGSKKQALSDVSAHVGRGLYLLAGENGAGKTTMIHVIAGLIRPQHGNCRIDSYLSTATNPAEMENLFDGALIMHQSHLLFAGTEEYVADKIAFEYSNDRDSEALYSENIAGRYLNMYPAPGHDETRVDWKALYLALHSDKSQRIISQLKKQ